MICKHCKKEFTPETNGQKYCTFDCRIMARNERERKARMEKLHKKKTDWAAIGKRLDELGMTYGQAVQRGLL